MPYRNCGGMIFSMPLASGETYAGHATLRLPRCTGMEGVYAACHPGLFRNEARPRAGVRTKSGRGDDGNLKRDFGISDPPASGASSAMGASSAVGIAGSRIRSGRVSPPATHTCGVDQYPKPAS